MRPKCFMSECFYVSDADMDGNCDTIGRVQIEVIRAWAVPAL